MLTIELHAHTSASKDSLLQPAQILAACRRRGVDRLAVTDHNTIRGALAAQKLAPEMVIVGEEIMTTQGELLAYFVRAEIPPGLTPAETIARLRGQGALISVAHPFDRDRRGAWREADLTALLPLVDAIEVFNARCLWPADNQRALDFAAAHHLLGTVGSDAHLAAEIGQAVLRLPAAGSPAELLAGWAQAERVTRRSSPLVHFGSTFAKHYKRLTRQKER